MKKKIRCYFTDFWNGFNYEYAFRFLFSEYEFLLDEKNPDYLFYSCNGNNHLNYNDCIKIFWSAEWKRLSAWIMMMTPIWKR